MKKDQHFTFENQAEWISKDLAVMSYLSDSTWIKFVYPLFQKIQQLNQLLLLNVSIPDNHHLDTACA